MELDPSSDSSSAPPALPRPPQGLIEKIFLSDDELRTIWRVLLYALFWITFSFGLDLLAVELFGFSPTTLSAQRVLREDVLGFLAALGAALAMAKLERRNVDVYGLPRDRAFGRLFWLGCIFGLVEVSVLLGAIAAFGGYSFGPISLHGLEITRWAGLWFVTFAAVGLSEEYLFRGYTQYTLGRGVGFWPAAIFLSVLFGAEHLWNPGESYVGAAGVTATGLLFAFTLRRTGNLWLAVGWHATFDFGETFLYSVPDSGMLFEHHLSSASLHGPAWLTGGSVGPEGSVFSFITIGILAIVVHFLFPSRKTVEERK